MYQWPHKWISSDHFHLQCLACKIRAFLTCTPNIQLQVGLGSACVPSSHKKDRKCQDMAIYPCHQILPGNPMWLCWRRPGKHLIEAGPSWPWPRHFGTSFQLNCLPPAPSQLIFKGLLKAQLFREVFGSNIRLSSFATHPWSHVLYMLHCLRLKTVVLFWSLWLFSVAFCITVSWLIKNIRR